MTLKLTISLPKETIQNIESLQEFISDLGDTLVNHGFGNEILMEDPTFDVSRLEQINSYIFISDEESNILENLENTFLVIPVKNEEGENNV